VDAGASGPTRSDPPTQFPPHHALQHRHPTLAVVEARNGREILTAVGPENIRILDRDTLAVVGQIPIGIGSRFPHLTRDGRTLFASSAAAHYAFDPDRLVN